MGSYMLLALFTMDSARLDSIILTMLFSGYNIETVHCALSVTAEAAWSHCGGWLSVARCYILTEAGLGARLSSSSLHCWRVSSCAGSLGRWRGQCSAQCLVAAAWLLM